MNTKATAFTVIFASLVSAGLADEPIALLMAQLAKGSAQSHQSSDDELNTIAKASNQIRWPIEKSPAKGPPMDSRLLSPAFFSGVVALRSEQTYSGSSALCDARQALDSLIHEMIYRAAPLEQVLAYRCQAALLLQITHEIEAARSAGVSEKKAGRWSVRGRDQNGGIPLPPKEMLSANVLVLNLDAQWRIFLNLWIYFKNDGFFDAVEQRKVFATPQWRKDFFLRSGFSAAELDQLLNTLSNGWRDL